MVVYTVKTVEAQYVENVIWISKLYLSSFFIFVRVKRTSLGYNTKWNFINWFYSFLSIDILRTAVKWDVTCEKVISNNLHEWNGTIIELIDYP